MAPQPWVQTSGCTLCSPFLQHKPFSPVCTHSTWICSAFVVQNGVSALDSELNQFQSFLLISLFSGQGQGPTGCCHGTMYFILRAYIWRPSPYLVLPWPQLETELLLPHSLYLSFRFAAVRSQICATAVCCTVQREGREDGRERPSKVCSVRQGLMRCSTHNVMRPASEATTACWCWRNECHLLLCSAPLLFMFCLAHEYA